MKKALIMAYAFPPIPYSGSYRIIRLCKGLSRLDIEQHILTIKTDPRIPNDFDLLKKVPKSVHIHRSSIPDPWLWFQYWKKDKPKTKRFFILNKIISFLLKFITIPDHQILWIPFAVIKGRHIIKKQKIDTLIISSPPNSTLISGCILKKLTKIKFIADLRDPIVGNIAQVNLIHATSFMSKIELLIHKWIESVVVKTADIVVTNTETHNKEMKFKYGHQPSFTTIRNSFAPDDYPEIKPKRYEKFTISYLGAIYGLRKVDLLFKGIKIIEQNFSEQGKNLKLQINLIGTISPEVESSIKKNGVEKYIKLTPRIPHKEAINTMLRSDALLLVKATGKGSLGQIPAKFFEYLGTGNPILCIAPKASEVAELIMEHNAGYVIEDSVEEMVEALKNLIAHQTVGSLENKAKIKSSLGELDNITMAKRMYRLIS